MSIECEKQLNRRQAFASHTALAETQQMCRLLIYKGTSPVQLSHVRVPFEYTDVLTSVQLLTRPAHSIINQAFDSRLRVDLRRPINGDGFGVGAFWGLPIKSRQVTSSFGQDGMTLFMMRNLGISLVSLLL